MSDPETWTRVGNLFHEAIARPSGERAAFVVNATPGAADADVRREVLSLVAAHERAARFIETPAADQPLTVGHYLVTRVLGAGGMGVVYLAEDSRLGRPVALKAVAPEFVDDPARRERLRREARAAAALHHPGIATIFALEEIDGHLYIAGEYVPGITLREEISRGPLPPDRAIDTLLAIARAVAAAHDRGIVHRDLKPENVMRTPDGAIKILDFGLARWRDSAPADAALSGDGTLVGTPAYMAPEQIRGAAVDGRADLFALGVMLYELLSGANPFAGRDAASTIANVLEIDPPAPGQPLPAALGRIVDTCLRKRPADRYASAHQLIAALEDARTPATGAPPDPVRGTPSGGTSTDRALWWWKFHQAATTLGYALLLVPLWQLRHFAEPLGTLLFAAGLMGATVAGGLRLHSWFAATLDRARWRRESRQSTRWRFAGDVVVAAALAIEGTVALVTREPWGILLVAAAAGVLVAFAIVEPSTARAAFDED